MIKPLKINEYSDIVGGFKGCCYCVSGWGNVCYKGVIEGGFFRCEMHVVLMTDGH